MTLSQRQVGYQVFIFCKNVNRNRFYVKNLIPYNQKMLYSPTKQHVVPLPLSIAPAPSFSAPCIYYKSSIGSSLFLFLGNLRKVCCLLPSKRGDQLLNTRLKVDLFVAIKEYRFNDLKRSQVLSLVNV